MGDDKNVLALRLFVVFADIPPQWNDVLVYCQLAVAGLLDCVGVS